MSLIYVFCDQNELKEWILCLCKEKNLGLLCLGDTRTWQHVRPESFSITDVGYQFFLFPDQRPAPKVLQMNEPKAREWGWITVRPGGVTNVGSKSVLLSSQIHGDKYDVGAEDPEKWLQWLKKSIKTTAHRGVRAKNTATDGEGVYKNMWYTSKARELFDAGVVWKQFPEDNLQFAPLDG
jgi:hypothetical protein